MKSKQVSFEVSADESDLIDSIIDRAEELGLDAQQDRMSTEMDISACIANGCPLKLRDWLTADRFNFAHDFYGITNNMDRETGKLKNCFLPRFSGKE